MEYTIKIPVKPHLKKFILYYYQYTEPIQASRDDKLGILIYTILDRNHLNWQPNHWITPKESIKFSVPENYYKRSGLGISAYNFSLFNNWVEAEFRFLLYERVDNKLNESDPQMGFYKNEIKSFLGKYKIDENDISTDAIVKDLYRKRKKNLGHNCPFELRRFNPVLSTKKIHE